MQQIWDWRGWRASLEEADGRQEKASGLTCRPKEAICLKVRIGQDDTEGQDAGEARAVQSLAVDVLCEG